MSKRLESSKDMETWETETAWTDEEASLKWGEVQDWIAEEQPYGFFRMVDDERSVEQIIEEMNKGR